AVGAGTPPTAADLARFTFGPAARLVFVDGRFMPHLSAPGELPQGVVVGSLAEAIDATPGELEPHLGRHARLSDHPFVALNTAFLRDGAFVRLPRGVVLEHPIHILYYTRQPAGGGAPICFPRNLLIAGPDSQVKLVETYAGAGAYFNCAVTELVAGPGSVIDHYKVQRESREGFHIATFQILGERASHLSSHSISIGGSIVRNDVNAVLDGEGIDCILNGLYLAEGRQLVDNHMRVEHRKPHCDSHELYKGILDGQARSVFNGLIHVLPGAQKTDAKQSNRNLLLSAGAIANSNPQLEIFANDVKCTHGSTVGQLDDDAVFYLRSRGIGLEAARSLLTYAFASDIVERIRVEPVRRDLEEFLFSRLPQGEVVRQAV
nr:Fe-S cluster assembly protein SufD [Acidobacteriota bacterium]